MAFDCSLFETCKRGCMNLTRSRFLICLLASVAIHSAAAEDKKSTFKAGELQFAVAEGWTVKAKARAMSEGGLTYKVAEIKEGLDADFYYFGKGAGGSVEANIARWKGQFEGGPKEVESAKLGGGKIDFLHLEGTFLSGPSFGKKTPKKDYAMLAAIVAHEDGPVFVKMTGPKDEVAKAIVAFKVLAESAYKK